LTKDDEIVVIHDEEIDRTANGTGFVKDLTLEQLKQYDFGSTFSEQFKGEPIPTLEEVLQVYLHTDHCLNVELKSDVIDYDGLEKKVLADRKSTRLNSSHVSSSYAVFCLKNKNILLCSIV